MSDKFKDKYRAESSRLQKWNYGWEAVYFITICTAKAECLLGKITDGQMIFSEIGEIVRKEWISTPEIRPDMNIELDSFCIMPNHFHGIIIVGENKYNCRNSKDGKTSIISMSDIEYSNDGTNMVFRDAKHRVSTVLSESALLIDSSSGENRFEPQRKNLASVIRGFKSSVTSYARIKEIYFAWQPLYYDHIIRNNSSYIKIKQYIENNILNWQGDRFYQTDLL
jgi:putative transposase